MRSRYASDETVRLSGNGIAAQIMSSTEDAHYEYWRDGERVRVFDNKDDAIRCYKTNCHKAKTSLHTVFKVYPTRKAVCQYVP